LIDQRKVGTYGNPARYQLGAYDGMQNKWMFNIKPGGTAEVKAFVPVNYRDESLFLFLQFLPGLAAH
jgi:hypothetical protein